MSQVASETKPTMHELIRSSVKNIIIKGEFEVPLLPQVATQVLKMINSPNVSISDMEKVVKQDQNIAARVIKTANSALYRGVSEITNLSIAMSRIGLKNIKDIVVSLSVQSGAFKAVGFEALMERLWVGSMASATIAQMLAEKLGADKEASFLAGLLHGIGRPIIIKAIAKLEEQERKRMADQAKASRQAFDPKKWEIEGLKTKIVPETIKEYDDFVGMAVAARWNLPPHICAVIKFKKRPLEAEANDQRLCWIVNLTESICANSGYGQDATSIDWGAHPAAKPRSYFRAL
jgi:HD-like signal output (HDOD) protein